MTDEMRGWFHHLATVEQEIRYDVERLEVEHLTPGTIRRQDPQIHPSLRDYLGREDTNARTAEASYAGRRLQTILFQPSRPEWFADNVKAARTLLATIEPEKVGSSTGSPSRKGLISQHIVSFLSMYHFHEQS